ncbi:MAG: CotH kinase family protein [Oscillospiraceae bacterium]|nr:CotH kinase family protein [Oscillospiraceae bacterium]
MRKLLDTIKQNRALAVCLTLALLLILGFVGAGVANRDRALPTPPQTEKTPNSPAPTVPLPKRSKDADKVCISEVMSKNRATLPDGDEDFPDWIELENRSDKILDLTGWRLTDKLNQEGWTLPLTKLGAGKRLVIFASGKDRTEGELHTNFALSQGETLYLLDAGGKLAGSVLCDTDTADVSLCRTESGAYVQSLYPTPGWPNDAAGYDAWQETLAPQGPLVISEVMVDNRKGLAAWSVDTSDWVEIRNVTDSAVWLGDYYLSDQVDDREQWRLPEQKLAAGAHLLLRCDDWVAADCTGFSLDSTADRLYLTGPEGLADYASLRDIPFGCSYGRLPGENGWFYFSAPNPGSLNKMGYRRVSAAPTALTPDGVFNDSEGVTVTLEAAGDIYYTTDSSVPTLGSEKYIMPILLTKTRILRAIAVEEGAMPSRPLTLSYIINQDHSLPVLSLVSDNSAVFNGMYSAGEKDREVQGVLSLYEEDGGFTIPCGIKMHGETSLVLDKKNMSVRFRGSYGQEELHYDLFDGGVDRFTNLVIRAGQDYYSGIIRNELCENLALAASDNIVTQRNKYCVLYVDGKYYGIHALQEKVNEQMYADLLGVSRKSVTVIEAEVPQNSALYQDVFSLCLNNDMSKAENYEQFCQRMDVDSLIDWMILEGYCANADLSFGNLRYCHSSEGDGLWRLMFYDLDSTFHEPELNFENVMGEIAVNWRQYSRDLIAPLLRNDAFRDRLLKRAAELLNGPLSNESTLAEIDRLAAQIEPEVARDYIRFDMTMKKWQWNIDYLRNFIRQNDWRRHNIDSLCRLLDLSQAERTRYFGKD